MTLPPSDGRPLPAPPTIDDISRARERIIPLVRRTPLVGSDWLSDLAGAPVYLKVESLQVTHSFKARGALNAVLALRERCREGEALPQLVTASAGNHGRALAWAAGLAGLRVVVFTPSDAPSTKLEAIRRLGAELRAEAGSYEESELMAKAFATETGSVFLSAYSNLDLIAGAASIALEIIEDWPAVDQIVVPVGGGGLLAGIASGARASGGPVEALGVEVEASHPFAASLAAGRIVEVEVGPTIADGLSGNMDPDNVAFPIIRDLVRRMTVVKESELHDAVRRLARHDHLIAEGAGAAAAAAVAAGHVACAGRHTAVILSGASIDLALLAKVLSGGLGA